MYDYIEDEVKDDCHLMALVLNKLNAKSTFLLEPFAKAFEDSVSDCLIERDRDVFCKFIPQTGQSCFVCSKPVNALKRVAGVEFSDDETKFAINEKELHTYLKDLAYNTRITEACENLSKQLDAKTDLYLLDKFEGFEQ